VLLLVKTDFIVDPLLPVYCLLSVIVNDGGADDTCLQVLLHGCILSEQNVDTVLDGIQRDLEKIESCLADSMLDLIPGHRDVSVDACQRV